MKLAGRPVATAAAVRLPEHARGLGAMRGLLVGWGLVTIAFSLLTFILPRDFEGIGRLAALGSGIPWCLFALSMSRNALRLCGPIVGVFVLQMWSVFTTVHAWIALGRPATVQRPETYLLEAVIPFFLASALVYIEPRARNWVLGIVVGAFSLSCLVGLLQFARFGPALSLSHLYTYKSIDYWDGTPGVRAVGLTWHPRALAFQALVCLAIFMGRVLASPGVVAPRREASRGLEVVLLFAYSAAVLATQARMSYFVLAACWAVFLVLLMRRNPKLTGALVLVGVVALGAAVAVAPKRFGYALQSQSTGKDASYQYRVDNAWSQLDPILDQHALTGIGPDQVMMFGTEPLVVDRWGGRALMESGYRLFLAMYGIPGLALACGILLWALAGAVQTLRLSATGADRRVAAFAALAALLYIAFNLYSSNLVDEVMPVPFAFLLGGLLMRDYSDERRVRAEAIGMREAAAA